MPRLYFLFKKFLKFLVFLHDIIGGMVRRHTFWARHTLCAHCWYRQKESDPTGSGLVTMFPSPCSKIFHSYISVG
jgi:hypothetical protein